MIRFIESAGIDCSLEALPGRRVEICEYFCGALLALGPGDGLCLRLSLRVYVLQNFTADDIERKKFKAGKIFRSPQF